LSTATPPSAPPVRCPREGDRHEVDEGVGEVEVLEVLHTADAVVDAVERDLVVDDAATELVAGDRQQVGVGTVDVVGGVELSGVQGRQRERAAAEALHVDRESAAGLVTDHRRAVRRERRERPADHVEVIRDEPEAGAGPAGDVAQNRDVGRRHLVEGDRLLRLGAARGQPDKHEEEGDGRLDRIRHREGGTRALHSMRNRNVGASTDKCRFRRLASN
jgi:hypothetical protein